MTDRAISVDMGMFFGMIGIVTMLWLFINEFVVKFIARAKTGTVPASATTGIEYFEAAWGHFLLLIVVLSVAFIVAVAAFKSGRQ